MPCGRGWTSGGRWVFAEFVDVFQMQTDFAKKVESEFNKLIEAATLPRTVELSA